jgi:RNA polymerase sigma-70 factor (ECF subfamily)
MENILENIVAPVNQTEGFDTFYVANFSKVNLTLVFMGVDEETARDLTQEAFTRLWLSWHRFENDVSRMKFLKVVSRNLWIDKYRKMQRESIFSSHHEEAFSLQEAVDYQDLLEAMNKALWKYDEGKRDMFFEIKLYGAPYKEVADKFNINIKTLERYMTQMSKSVKSFLEKYYPHISAIAVIFSLL